MPYITVSLMAGVRLVGLRAIRWEDDVAPGWRPVWLATSRLIPAHGTRTGHSRWRLADAPTASLVAASNRGSQ